jgi:ATP-dependent helicase Lhr and Lhr-like helicase
MSDPGGPGDSAAASGSASGMAAGEGGGRDGGAVGLGRLNPSLAHHIVNTLGWADLRPLQSEAIGPLLAGEDALLLAPTAGGKTEAAVFPLLSRMTAEGWGAPSLIYLAPLNALLNNLLPRLETYGGWAGRRAALWHGDVTSGARARLLRDPPDVLLTTPESLESMLVSANVDHYRLFGPLRAVVVDEVHAFAGDDRGWHLLAVLERLCRLTGQPLQRVGLSATVGNPEELMSWLQGSGAGRRAGRVIAPDADLSLGLAAGVADGVAVDLPGRVTSGPEPGDAGLEPGDAGGAESASALPAAPGGDLQLDYVGSVDNAAKVIAALHQGEKRLVFCDSRRLVEELGAALRARGVTAFLSHASLSLDERRRAEQAFADSRNCVIVATSTLELGVDVGDLDRVIQINAPATVASLLQRLGRSGRRAGLDRNCLFLALDQGGLLDAAGLLVLWGRGFVEPVVPPPDPRHIVAQQILALCLQEHRVGENLLPQWWNGLGPFGPTARPILAHLVREGYLDSDGGMLFIGPEAEKRFGRRHFMELTTAFTVMPQFTVLNGREEIGRTDPALLTAKTDGPRLLLLAGHSWRVTWIDWKRRRCFVEPAEGGGKARWIFPGMGGASFALSRAIRDVLLGTDPPVRLTRRAHAALAEAREIAPELVHPGGTVVSRGSAGDVRWWTWAGWRANATLIATLGDMADSAQRVEEFFVRLRHDATPQAWKAALTDIDGQLCLPAVDDKALDGLKFSVALPRHLAEATLAARLADLNGARIALAEPHRFLTL